MQHQKPRPEQNNTWKQEAEAKTTDENNSGQNQIEASAENGTVEIAFNSTFD
ncbi:MAG: hypothetical protein WB870_11370 [Gallionellaceae bacterium]